MKYFSYLSLILLFSIQVSAQNRPAFQEGEELMFKVRYGWFKASEANLKIEAGNFNNTPVYHIIGTGKSTGMLDVFFKVRDHFETYLDKDKMSSHKFIRKTNEGGHKKDRQIVFNQDNLTAEVNNFKKNTVSTHSIKENTQDLLSALYALRNQVDINNLEVGQNFYLNMFFDEENFNFKAQYLGKEIIDTKFGTVETLKFRPYVQAERVFKEKESVTIWVSNDYNKIPLKIEAKLAVGALTAELDGYRGLKNSFRIIMD
ncbi:MAG: DUF3108 domain-containing protein [Bacteroidota bacterium]